MNCPKCNSNNVNLNVVNEVTLKNKHHGILWWLLGGWILSMIKWLVLTIPALIFAVFGHKKQKAVNKQKTVCVCQDCGYRWDM